MPRWPGDEPGAPLPPRKRRGPPRVTAQPLPRRRPWPSCLPPPSGRATFSGAEARSRQAAPFEGVRERSLLPPTCCSGVSQGAAGCARRAAEGGWSPSGFPRPLAPPHSCLVGNKTPRPGRVIGHPDGDICLLNLDVSCAPHLAVLQGLLAGFCIPPLTSAPFRGSPPSISSLPHHRVTSNLPAFYLWHLDPRPAPAPDPRLALSPSPLAPTPSSPGPRGALVTLRPVPAGLTAPARVPFLLTRALACLQSKVTLWLRD